MPNAQPMSAEQALDEIRGGLDQWEQEGHDDAFALAVRAVLERFDAWRASFETPGLRERLTKIRAFVIPATISGETSRCTYCDREANAGERWLSDGDDWIYCSAECYAQVVEGTVIDDGSLLDDAARERFTDALIAGQKALASAKV